MAENEDLTKRVEELEKQLSSKNNAEQMNKIAEATRRAAMSAKELNEATDAGSKNYKEIDKNIETIAKNKKTIIDYEQIENDLKEERLNKLKEEFRINQQTLLQLLEEREVVGQNNKELNDKIEHLKEITREQGKQIQDANKEKEIKEKILVIAKEMLQLTRQYGSELEKHIIQISTLNGGYDKYKETIGEANKLLYASTVGTGIMFEEANQSIQQLSSNFIGLSTQSAESIKQMSSGVAQLGKLGVDAATASRGFDSLVNAMGKTPAQAYKIQESFVQMASKNRLALGSVTQAFAENSSRFVGYGAQMTKVLDGLAEQSLKTGIAIGKLVGIAQGFDTFEDASRKVGNLNALLGGDYFNSIELLTASDEERIRLIKEGVAASGMQFESMNRFEKMAIANAAGISDLNEASKLFGQTSLQNTRQQAEGAEVQKTLAEQAQSATLAMDKLKSSFNGLLIILEPIITTFMEVANKIANAVQEFKGFLEELGLGTTAAAALTSALLAIPLIFPVLAAGFVAVAVAIAGFVGGIVSSLLPVAKFGNVAAGAISKVGLAATKGSIGLLALGAAIGLAAAGIGILIYGFADLTKYLAPLVDTFFNGINDALKSLISINPVSLYNIAAGLVAMAGGFAAITAASMGNIVVGGISAFAGVFSKKPTSVFEMLATLSEITNKFPVDGLQKIVSSILSFGNISNINVGSISSLVSELSNVNIDPINKLAEAIGTLGANLTMLASLSATGIKVEGTATNVVDTAMTAAAVSTINATNSAVKSQALIPTQQTTAFVPLVVQIDKKTIIEILKEDIANIAKGQASDRINAIAKPIPAGDMLYVTSTS
jgi:hypothetical protein